MFLCFFVSLFVCWLVGLFVCSFVCLFVFLFECLFCQFVRPPPQRRGLCRPRYSNSTKNFKRPKNREDSSDVDENLTDRIAAMRSIILKMFLGRPASKTTLSKLFFAKRCLNKYRCAYVRTSKSTRISRVHCIPLVQANHFHLYLQH